MSVGGAVALAVAERIERTGGARAGLVAWRTLAANSVDAEVRAKALLAGLRCAVAAADKAALSELAVRWGAVERGLWDEQIIGLAVAMERAALLPQALELAEVEVRRSRTARALYLRARCIERLDGDAAAAFRETVGRAENEGASEIALAARTRLAELQARSWMTMAEALEEAARVLGAAGALPESRLIAATVLLASPSRFVRAGALGALDDLTSGPLARRALVTVARWVDDFGSALSPLELERLVALFGREHVRRLAPRAADAMRAIARGGEPETLAIEPTLAPILARARDIAGGRFEPVAAADAATGARTFHAEILDVFVALRDEAPARAIHPLRRLAAAEAAGVRLPRQALFAAELALRSDDAELREVSVRFFRARLGRARPGAPPAGFLALAQLATSAGARDVADLARRAAAATKEPGAIEALGTESAREGWELAAKGDRKAAIAKLREARATFRR